MNGGKPALTRYYCDAGAGGVAVGVHTTQFAIHDPKTGLLEPVLRLAADAVRVNEQKTGRKVLKVAGICGPTDQAAREAGPGPRVRLRCRLVKPFGAPFGFECRDSGALPPDCRG